MFVIEEISQLANDNQDAHGRSRPCVVMERRSGARSPAQCVLRIARRHGVELIVTASGSLPWHERLLNGDPVRELLAAEVSVFVFPATSAPAFALDERYRICALNGAAGDRGAPAGQPTGTWAPAPAV